MSQRIKGSRGQLRCSAVGRRLLASSGRGEDVSGARGRELLPATRRGRDHVHLFQPRSDKTLRSLPRQSLMCQCTANVDTNSSGFSGIQLRHCRHFSNTLRTSVYVRIFTRNDRKKVFFFSLLQFYLLLKCLCFFVCFFHFAFFSHHHHSMLTFGV